MFWNKEKILKCPKCKVPMQKIQQDNVTLDVCARCKGLFVDYGELDKLMAQKKSKLKK